MANSQQLNVALMDIRSQTHALRAELQPALDQVLADACFALGPAVDWA